MELRGSGFEGCGRQGLSGLRVRAFELCCCCVEGGGCLFSANGC